MTKPTVFDSMIISFYERDTLNNFIINLDTIQLTHKKNDIVRIELPNTPQQKEWPKLVSGFAVCVSDDPTLGHAGAWMNMGCGRISYTLGQAKNVRKRHLCYEGRLASKSIIIPERIPENANHPANLYI